MLRVLRPGGPDDFVLPGAGHGRAHWLGRIPRDAGEIRIAAGPGFVLERVGLRAEAGILGQCLLRRPWRFAAALYERARGSERRYRDILRGACAVTPLAGFEAWAASRARPVQSPAVRLRVRCLILDPADDAAALARTADALARQTHADWTAVVMGAQARGDGAAGGPVTRRAWDPALSPAELLGEADALCVWEAGDEPAPDALALLAAALGGADLAYADAVGPDGAPRLKPDWSPDLALATGYAGRPCLLSRALVARLPGAGLGPLAGAAGALDVAATLAACEAVHLPRILARTAPDTPDAAGRAAAIDRGLAAVGAPARAAIRGGSVEIVWPLPSPAPRVSVVIPSRDRLDLIGRVCRGVLHETAYPDIELVIVDNGSVEPAVLAHYDALRRDPRVRILADPRPFNFAAMVNAGVEAATGTVVVLLNNDVAVLEPGWLEALVRQACRPGVGAVGAKLLYGDGRLQHAGVVVGLGGRAGHILRRRPGDTPGHLGRLRTAHEVSAVTAACLAVARDTYRAVGGLDAEAFPVDFNDVDFCLRLGAAGWKTVWTPAATLAHLESVSRGPSVGEKRARFEREAARFSERWRAVIRHDPYYHPALSLTTFGEDLE
ncbi:glycosyltransferase [Methylobacterium sp. NEAU 140]|nr:glycosyltransferase [Methylobacterium sp. NEAU 140]MDP4023555.1 glycosyltransferase [Methylobacterium sp. NEAU 140]